MLNIVNSAALARTLDSPLNDKIRHLLITRRDELAEHIECDIGELAQWIVIESGDSVADIEKAAGYPIVTDPAFEWVLDHGGLFELPTVLSDDGFGVVLIVPDVEGIDPALLTLCREHATAA